MTTTDSPEINAAAAAAHARRLPYVLAALIAAGLVLAGLSFLGTLATSPLAPAAERYPPAPDFTAPAFAAGAGTLTVAGWLAWRDRLPLGPLADLFAPDVALGIAFERAGCVVRDDCFGAVAAPPLGIVFPGLSQPRYPASLYEAALALGLFAALLLWRARRRFHGELGLAFLVAYPLLRAAMDLTRIKLGPWPSADQVVSVAVALTAVGMWLWRRSVLERVPALWPGRPGPVGRVGPEASESDPVHPDPLRGRQVL